MKTQIDFCSLNLNNKNDINKRLAELQPPNYQIVDIKVVPAEQYTHQCNIVIIYNEYEV